MPIDFAFSAMAARIAAIAMLGKYYSVFLVGSFIFAAVFHPQRRVYFKSIAPWVSTAVGLFVLTPHLYWLTTTGAMPFHYALAAQTGVALIPSLTEVAYFLLGNAASMAVAAWHG